MPTLLQPRALGAHLGMLLAVAAAVGLGVWQLNVWSAHRAHAQRDLVHAKPVTLASVMGRDSAFPGGSLGRPVTFAGRWMPSATTFVSDRRLDGHNGYWVVTPVRVTSTGSAMPVVRGWASRPSAPVIDGTVAVTGWLQASESDAPDDNPGDDVLPSMRIASLTQHVDADLYSGYVVREQADGGLRAVTPQSVPPVSSTTSLRNLLYAFQWWFFGGFAIYIWLRWCRDQLEVEDKVDAEATPPVLPPVTPDLPTGTFVAVKPLFLAYRVLATVVGLSIITLVVIGVPLKYAHDLWPDFWTTFLQVGEPGQKLGANINLYLGTAHGFIYMAFVLVALMLALQARWPLLFTLVTLVSGTVPFLSFWAEARAIRRVRREFPDLSGPISRA